MMRRKMRPSKSQKNGWSCYSRIPLSVVSNTFYSNCLECKGSMIHLVKKGSKPVATEYKRKRIEMCMSFQQFKEE